MKRSLNKVLIGCIVLVGLISSCKKDMPKEVLKQDKMESLLYDYHIAKSMINDLPYEERYKEQLYMDYVFNKHQVSKADFDSSLVWYSRHTGEMTKVYEKVNKRLKLQEGVVNHLIAQRSKKTVITSPGDTVNIWMNAQSYILTPSMAFNKLIFNIPTDSNFHEKDSLVWKFRYSYIAMDSIKPEAWMSMTIQFDNDSLIHAEKRIRRPGTHALRLKSDSTWKIKEVRGSVYYSDTVKAINRSTLIDQIALMRYRAKKDTTNVVLTDSLKADSIKKADAAKLLKKDTVPVEQTVPRRKRPTDLNHSRTLDNKTKLRRIDERSVE